jgi:hypothetical protein
MDSFNKLGNPVVVKDTGDVVVYQYPLDDDNITFSDNSLYRIECYDANYSSPYHDDERTLDDKSLAAQDALTLEQDRYLDPDMPRAIAIKRKRRRGCILLITALLLLIGVIVLTSVFASRNDRKGLTEQSQLDVDNASSVDRVEGEGGEFLATPNATTAPPVADSTSVTFAPTKSPTVSPTNLPTLLPTNPPTLLPTNLPTNLPTVAPTNTLTTISSTAAFAMMTLSPIVANPSLLLDTTTSEGQAYAAVSAENLTDPQDIVQRYSLLALYFASEGSDWVQQSGWNTPGTDACTWFGTGCNANGQVATLSLCKCLKFHSRSLIPPCGVAHHPRHAGFWSFEKPTID